MTKTTDLGEFRKRREADRYKATVLDAFDRLEHQDRRAFLDKRAAIENENRQKL